MGAGLSRGLRGLSGDVQALLIGLLCTAAAVVVFTLVVLIVQVAPQVIARRRAYSAYSHGAL